MILTQHRVSQGKRSQPHQASFIGYQVPLFEDSQVTMALTPAKAMEAFDHVVNVVFQVPKEGLLYKALEKSGDTDIRDMISLKNPDINSLTYDRSDTDQDIPISRGDKNLL